MRIAHYLAPKTIQVEEIEDLPIQANEVRIESIISGLSHGTEMSVYRGIAPFFRKRQDGKLRLFVPAEETETWGYPIRSCDPGVWYLGYASVGKVVEIGNEVSGLSAGDMVYSSSPHQSQVIKPADQVIKLPLGINPEHGVFLTNLLTAYNGILDSRIKLGDTVVVSGLGVVGQLVAQMAKMSGAFQVIGVDLFEKRLNTALANGVDKVYSPGTCNDIARAVRGDTGGKGADLVIDVTGNPKALNEAIRIAAPDTTVTALGWYQGDCSALNLAEEFHFNRIKIRSSQTGRIDPAISHTWNSERKTTVCVELLRRLQLDNIISHRIPYERIADAYEMVDQHPEQVVQVALTY